MKLTSLGKLTKKHNTNENLTLKPSVASGWGPKQRKDETTSLDRSSVPTISVLICKRHSLQPWAAVMLVRFKRKQSLPCRAPHSTCETGSWFWWWSKVMLQERGSLTWSTERSVLSAKTPALSWPPACAPLPTAFKPNWVQKASVITLAVPVSQGLYLGVPGRFEYSGCRNNFHCYCLPAAGNLKQLGHSSSCNAPFLSLTEKWLLTTTFCV